MWPSPCYAFCKLTLPHCASLPLTPTSCLPVLSAWMAATRYLTPSLPSPNPSFPGVIQPLSKSALLPTPASGATIHLLLRPETMFSSLIPLFPIAHIQSTNTFTSLIIPQIITAPDLPATIPVISLSPRHNASASYLVLSASPCASHSLTPAYTARVGLTATKSMSNGPQGPYAFLSTRASQPWQHWNLGPNDFRGEGLSWELQSR